MSDLVNRLRDGRFLEPDIWEAADRIEALEAAARNLVKVKGRYHTQQAYEALAALVNPMQATDKKKPSAEG
jgi:hypothetical protein